MTKSESGRLGGMATFAKYGKKHMKAIGKLGGIAFHNKYRLVPVGVNLFAIVDRQTDEFKAFTAKQPEWRM